MQFIFLRSSECGAVKYIKSVIEEQVTYLEVSWELSWP